MVDFSKSLYHGDVTMIIAPGVEGDIGILSGHAPLVAQLRPGFVRIFQEDRNNCQSEIQIESGFLLINNDLCEIYCLDHA